MNSLTTVQRTEIRGKTASAVRREVRALTQNRHFTEKRMSVRDFATHWAHEHILAMSELQPNAETVGRKHMDPMIIVCSKCANATTTKKGEDKASFRDAAQNMSVLLL